MRQREASQLTSAKHSGWCPGQCRDFKALPTWDVFELVIYVIFFNVVL